MTYHFTELTFTEQEALVRGAIVLYVVIMLIALAVMIGFGIACSNFAGKKGRSKVGYFFFGFVFGILALVVVLLLEDVRPQMPTARRVEHEYEADYDDRKSDDF